MRNRTYALTHHANETKLERIRQLLPLWRSALVTVQVVQTRKLKNGERLGWLTAEELKPLNLPLSARQLKSMTNQVNAALRSWQELVKRDVRTQIKALNIKDKDERKRLFTVNLYCDWWNDSVTKPMVEEALKRIPFPNPAELEP